MTLREKRCETCAAWEPYGSTAFGTEGLGYCRANALSSRRNIARQAAFCIADYTPKGKVAPTPESWMTFKPLPLSQHARAFWDRTTEALEIILEDGHTLHAVDPRYGTGVAITSIHLTGEEIVLVQKQGENKCNDVTS